MRFFDASALVKRYVRERHSARVVRLLRTGHTAVSRVSEVEVVSVFTRLAREEAMSPAQRDRAATAFVSDFGAWTVVELTPEVTAVARRLLMQQLLRTGDALQLASALALQAGIGRRLEAFVAFDHRLLAAARAEQMAVVGGR